MAEQRRSTDPLVSQLATDVAQLQSEMKRNTEVTEQVRDILSSFKVMMAVAKWFTAVAGAIAAAIALFKAGGGDIRFK